MLLTVKQFINRVNNDLNRLVEELQDHTGRSGNEESEAWRESFPAILPALARIPNPDIHIHFADRGQLSLEYRLPASFSFADLVLLGAHDGRPSAVFVELKHWLTRADSPGSVEGLINRQGGISHHPSDQVGGYVEYCRRFHSSVLANDAEVAGCVWFTRDQFYDAYLQPPNSDLAGRYPCFSVKGSDVETGIPEFMSKYLSEPDEGFAQRFEEGRYAQDRDFCRTIAEMILHPDSPKFVLLDNQRFAFHRCWEHVQKYVFGPGGPQRCVILIEGPPGSGKSVIAARLWASLISDSRLDDGSVVITTTSMAQNTSWGHLFESVAQNRGARGAIRKANTYMPISTHEFGKINKRYPGALKDSESWRDNLSLLRNIGQPFRTEDQELLISIVDEAHALINPEHTSGRGQFGFAPALGPQAWHIMRSSIVSIILLDSQQNFRERENTTIDDIRTWAAELDAIVPGVISLNDAQFRCNGSKEYVDWVDGLLAPDPDSNLQSLSQIWKPIARDMFTSSRVPRAAEPEVADDTEISLKRGSFDFRVYEHPQLLEDALREQAQRDRTVRIAASYSREWRTKDYAQPHEVVDELKDFQIQYEDGFQTKVWTRIWNHIQNGDYSGFTQAAPGSRMYHDPLCEVGCPYALRGFDFDYVGLLWFSDLIWRRGHWIVQPEHVHETGQMNAINRARKEDDPNGPDHRFLLDKVKQAYRILLTRAIRGTYVWFEDKQTEEHVLDVF